MYDSIKEWCNIPIQIKKFKGMDGAGDVSYDLPEEILCYMEGKLELIRNFEGDEVLSSRKVYVDEVTTNKFWPYRDSDTEFIAPDLLIIDGREYPVQAIAPFYREGKIDLSVVYV